MPSRTKDGGPGIGAIRSLLSLILLPILLASCSSDSATGPDTTPPAAVSDLTAAATTDTSITITWTAPGDDGTRGRAALYEIRLTTSGMITSEATWDAAQNVPYAPVPAPPGSQESFTIRNLHPGWTYFYALKTADEVPNWSTLSNPHGVTTSDGVPPARIEDLWAESRGSNGVLLRWTSPSDNDERGHASLYHLRLSLAEITDEDWSSATPIEVSRSPARAGDPESLLVGGLDPETSYHFAMRAEDAGGNLSPVSNDIPFETTYGSRTRPGNLLENLRLAWIHRDYFEYERLFAPSFVFVFASQDVGGPYGIPESWTLAEEATSAVRLFGGQPNAEGYRALDVQLSFSAGTVQDSAGVSKLRITNVRLEVRARSVDGVSILDYLVENGAAEFDIVQTSEADPGSGLPILAITRWRDLTVPVGLTQPASWGFVKALWR